MGSDIYSKIQLRKEENIVWFQQMFLIKDGEETEISDILQKQT